MMIGAVFGFLLRGILGNKPAPASQPAASAPSSMHRLGVDLGVPASLDLAKLGVSVAVEANILEALGRGSKIEAIKLLREATGLGLKESKDAIEYLEASIVHANDSRS
ncbi:hypothetical protein C7S18_13255 [Ahniella affigens]|uniref:Large ribosomal subunit protein bL12 C-terminal domain-containing protein n=2 Tax=Ahniella affigens TaxID=2021234 RepID=A0A2P1PZ39_9GAMM|nr:hypothetical protein C7S18_13255 [Ahniella affigens]